MRHAGVVSFDDCGAHLRGGVFDFEASPGFDITNAIGVVSDIEDDLK